MSVKEIRRALAIVFRTALDEAGEKGSALAYPPDSVGGLPVAFCGLNDVTITYSASLEENQHALQAVFLIERIAGLLPSGLERLEAIEEAFRVAMRASAGLPDAQGQDTVNMAVPTRIQQDTLRIGDVPYLGFVATLDIIDKFEVTLE